MSDVLAQAERVVRAARVRMQAARATQRAVGWLLAGAAVTLAGVGIAALAEGGDVLPLPLLVAVPLAAAGVGAATVLARPRSIATAALELDACAATDEAFLSALTAVDARMEFRELAAAYALERCPLERVRRVLPVGPPPSAPAAAVVFALLLVVAAIAAPAASDAAGASGAAEPIALSGGGSVAGSVGASEGTATMGPADRVAALAEVLAGREEESGTPATTSSHTEAARRDLAAVGVGELEALADALALRAAASGSTAQAEAAERAHAALTVGDAAAAARALLEGLGPSRGPSGGAGPGSSGARPGAATTHGTEAGVTSARTWPLCYDRRVRRWFEASVGSGDSAHGGQDK